MLADEAEETGTRNGEKLARDMRIVRRNADKLQTFQNNSLADQLDILNELRQYPSLEDARFFELAQKNFAETQRAASEGRLMELEAQRGLIDPVPLSDPQTREVQARQLSEKYGAPVPVFMPSEVEEFVDDIDTATSDVLTARYAELTSSYSQNAVDSLAAAIEDTHTERPSRFR
ncbi:MAG: hypothetical protein AAF950_17765 [Pseudomonadota bacterium]